MLLLKLLMVPLLLAGVSLAARRWGPQVGGLLAGFPVVTGPILIFLCLEQGPRFAAEAARGSVLAVVACVVFGVVYCHSGRRFSWPVSASLGLLAWLGSAAVLAAFPGSMPWAAALALLAVTAGPSLLPPSEEADQPPAPLPGTELGARMLAGAVLVVAVTAVAASAGTRWAGLMAMFPVLGTVLGVCSLRQSGPRFVARLFRGMFRGFYSFTAFCVSAALLLPVVPAGIAFATSVAVALTVQAGLYGATAPNNSSKPKPLRGSA
jgi:hypothetical protein